MAEVVLLRELMNTRYIIQSLAGQFTMCLEQCKENGYTVDLNGCRFGPDCVEIMYQYYSVLDFCNTEDPALDRLLKQNCEAARQTLEEYPELNLYNTKDLSACIDLINSLPQGAKYRPYLNQTSLKDRAALVMLIMARPDIEFDIRSYAVDVFEFVRDLWVVDSEHHESYWELIPPNITVRDINENGLYGSQEYGFMSEYDFVRHRKVLPVEFGNSQIIKLGEDNYVSDEWRPTVEKCIGVFESVTESDRTPGKRVRDFLTFREDG